jgi:hypothetical protein
MNIEWVFHSKSGLICSAQYGWWLPGRTPVKRRIPQTDKGRHGILILVTSPQLPPSKRVLLLKPRGFCAGVVRAIDVVNIALDTFGAPIYVRKEIVHNRFVVNELAEKGIALMESPRRSGRAASRAN